MVDGVTTATANNRISAGGASLVSNFETFLSLLTAQLRNQDPLSPVDSNQFTAQLTQMAGVEQQLLTNDLLTSLLEANQGGGLSDAAQYIGKTATAGWSATKLEDGAATWSYELAGDARSAKLEVLDSTGKVVWTGDADDLGEGVHDFTWDGKTTAGGQLPDGGIYSLKITAVGSDSRTVASQVLIRGQVSGVEMYDGQPYLTIGNSIVPMTSVIALEQRMTPATPANDDDDPSLLATIASSLNPLKLFS
ncbi:MAG: flagellar hook assembly protein FlgD [Pseudomonadota bacterium]|nr:flagellar hook assembly protein FlgD [Pseudomonadota bacterium]